MKYISAMRINKLFLHTTWNNLTNIKTPDQKQNTQITSFIQSSITGKINL